jgi:hypothetical protein
MASDVQLAQPVDAPKLAEVFFAAFSDRFNRTMFPDKPDVRIWIEKNLLCGEGISEDQVMLKVTDPSNPDMVVAFAKWVRPSSVSHADHDRRAEGPAVWPESSNGELCDRFFGTMGGHHKEIMKERPHYCMFVFLLCSSAFVRSLMADACPYPHLNPHAFALIPDTSPDTPKASMHN